MLRETSVDSVMTLANKVADAKIVVEALPQSPLAQAVEACYTPILESTYIKDASLYDVRYRLLDASRTAGVDKVVKHDQVMENIVDVISKSVTGSLNLAKNVVNPIVKAVVGDAELAIRAADIKQVNILSVMPDFFKKLWLSPVFETMVDRYSDAPINEVQIMRIHAQKTPEEINQLVNTGASRFDTEVQQWVAEMPADFLLSVYNDFFAKEEYAPGQPQVAKYNVFNDVLNGTGNREVVLAIHLISRKLKGDIQEGLNMDLGDYREYMTKVMEQSGRALCRILEKRTRDLKNRTLLVSWPATTPELVNADTGVITVMGEVYNDWLAEGGAPEILFGSYLTDKNGGYNALLQAGAEYKKAWQRQAALLRTHAMSSRYNTALVAIRNAVTKQINAIPDEQLVVVSRAALHKRLVEELDGVSGRDLEDLYGVARKVVCRVMFAHTDAEKILAAIDEVGRANPDMDIREAALYGTIDYVVAWMAQQFKITTV